MNDGEFSRDEQLRYSRHRVLPGFGDQGQHKLKQARVLVAGAGGLGSPVLTYLAAAGVGHLTLVDFDTVTISNLQRQVLFSMADIEKPKASVAAGRLRQLNPNVRVTPVQAKLTSINALEILDGHDVVVDCTDNFPARYLLNDACVILDIPLVYGSIFRYEGQVAVFNSRGGPNYRDLYPVPPSPGSVPDCEEGGVLGTLPGIIGSIQANETIKLLAGVGESLAGKLLVIDSLTMETQTFHIPNQNQRAAIRSLIDYDEFCGLRSNKTEYSTMKEVTVQELKRLIDTKADFQLIDVREPHEFDLCNLDGELIPMADVPNNTDQISRDKQVVVHCRSGKRSGDIILWLEKNKGYTNLYNLKGGILAWAKEIDPTMPTY